MFNQSLELMSDKDTPQPHPIYFDPVLSKNESNVRNDGDMTSETARKNVWAIRLSLAM